MIGPFQDLLNELGRVFHLELHADKFGACSILIPPELVIQLQIDSSQEKLFLFSKIVEIPPGKFRENVLCDCLKANALPDPLPGILAFLAATSHLILFQSYPLSILNGERLASLFAGFREMAENWRKAVLSGKITPKRPASQEKPFGLRP